MNHYDGQKGQPWILNNVYFLSGKISKISLVFSVGMAVFRWHRLLVGVILSLLRVVRISTIGRQHPSRSEFPLLPAAPPLSAARPRLSLTQLHPPLSFHWLIGRWHQCWAGKCQLSPPAARLSSASRRRNAVPLMMTSVVSHSAHSECTCLWQ